MRQRGSATVTDSENTSITKGGFRIGKLLESWRRSMATSFYSQLLLFCAMLIMPPRDAIIVIPENLNFKIRPGGQLT